MATNNKNFRVKNGLDVSGEISSLQSSGSEGGQINLSKPETTSLSGDVAIDIYGNKIRFFDKGGSARGAYIDLTAAATGVGTDLLGGVTGAMNASYTYASKQTNVSGNGVTLASVSLTTNGYPIQVIATGDMENNSAGGWVTLQLYRGSTAIGNIVHAESSAGSENVPFALTAIDVPAAGTYTYHLKVNISAGGTFNFGESNGPTITVIELSGPKGDTGASGLADIVSDTTPQLGGDLDTNGYDITGLNALTLDTTPTGVPSAAGVISWDADAETVNAQLNGSVNLQIGQEHLIRVKNNSGSVAIPNGTVVMFAGAAGDTVKVTPAVSTSSNEPYTLVGITTQEISADGTGFVTQFGFIHGLDTSGYTLGALLYSDPATPGALTATPPAAPNWTFPIAAVTRVGSGSSGIILVRAIPGSHIHDITDVTIDSPADNEVLAWNSATSTWINQTADEAGLKSGVFDGYAKYNISDIQQKTTSYTLVLTDANDLLEVNSSSGTTITVPTNASVAFPTKTEIHILQTGTGQITVAGDTGVTVNGTPGLKFRDQWSMATLIKRDTDTWILVGDLTG